VVEYSTSYGSGWEAETVVGSPRVFPRYGDHTGAWAPARSRGTFEFLVLEFHTPVYITGVDIFETYNPGHITKISIYNEEGNSWVEVFTTEAANIAELSRVYSPPLDPPVLTFRSNRIRIDLDCQLSRSWSEIDCVCLRGCQVLDWTPENHKYYPDSFKQAVKALLLVNLRHISQTNRWLPDDIIYHIIQYSSITWPASDRELEALRKKQQEEEDAKQKRDAIIQQRIDDVLSGRLALLLELCNEGQISDSVYAQKKVESIRQETLTVLNQYLKSGEMLSPEFDRRVAKLDAALADPL